MSDNSITVALIGAGQLGSRHLQALTLIDRSINIQVVDPNRQSLKTAQERFLQMQDHHKVANLSFFQDINLLNEKIDIAIIATSSDVRRQVIEELLQGKRVSSLILEKVLFQRLNDFDEVGSLLRRRNIPAWVNCPRRIWPFYMSLKEQLVVGEKIDFLVTGSGWDLGTNAIHFLDLFAFLTDENDFAISSGYLNDSIIESKRKGYYRFSGTFQGFSKKGSSFGITSYANGDAPIQLLISGDKFHCVIRESDGSGFVKLASSATKWEWEEFEFAIPLQSQLTHLAVQEILDEGKCGLTPYLESCKIHFPFLQLLIRHHNSITGQEGEVCPIT